MDLYPYTPSLLSLPLTPPPDNILFLLFFPLFYSSVQFSHLVMSDCLQPHESQHARPPCPITNYWRLLKLMSIELVMPSSHLILCQPLLLLPPIPPSIRVFSN